MFEPARTTTKRPIAMAFSDTPGRKPTRDRVAPGHTSATASARFSIARAFASSSNKSPAALLDYHASTTWKQEGLERSPTL